MSRKTITEKTLEVKFRKYETFVLPCNRIDTQILVAMFLIKNYLAEKPRFAIAPVTNHLDGVSVGAYDAPFYGESCGEIAVAIAVAAGKLDDYSGDLLLRLCRVRYLDRVADTLQPPYPEEAWYKVFEAYEKAEVMIMEYFEEKYELTCNEIETSIDKIE